jgi:hypothetical protein
LPFSQISEEAGAWQWPERFPVIPIQLSAIRYRFCGANFTM